MNKKVIAANYAYFILVDSILRWILVVLFIPIFPFFVVYLSIKDGFERTYTREVQTGDLNLWKKE